MDCSMIEGSLKVFLYQIVLEVVALSFVPEILSLWTVGRSKLLI